MIIKEYFQKAKQEKWAIGHFNFSTADQLKAIVEAAAELKSPVMVATSEGEEKFIGLEQAIALVRSWQDLGYPVFLNADHHKTWESVSPCIEEGYDTVLIDASKLPFEENVALTKKVVEYARTIDPDMMVEGELGYLRGDSEVQKKVEITVDDYTNPRQAQEFVERTGIHRLAIAFGNIHGIVTDQKEQLNFDVLKDISAAIPETPLVLHGASGLSDEDIKESIKHGICNIHINTELRIAYHDALEKELAKDDESTTPHKFIQPAFDAAKALVKKKLELFGSVGKI
ncbi:MAG: class II fructose-bisphosphate aldolase [Patescibacteria group bacterium]